MFRRVRQVRTFWNSASVDLIEVQGAFSLDEMERKGAFVEHTAHKSEPPAITPVLNAEPGVE